MKPPKTHPTNPRLRWIIRYGSGSWEVEPCKGNDLPTLPPPEIVRRRGVSKKVLKAK